MKLFKVVILFFVVCTILLGCRHNIVNQADSQMRFGKNIIITVSGDEMIDSVYLQNVIDGTIKKDSTYFDLLDNEEISKLIKYMNDNDYIIKPGTYELNQSWKFDNGKFVLNNGDKKTVFNFQKKLN